MYRVIIVGLALLLPAPVMIGDGMQPKDEIISTFSIAAIDPESGMCGVAVASRAPTACRYVGYARPGVGAFCTQYSVMEDWGAKALNLLADKKLPEEVLAELLKTDKDAGSRQLAIIDMKGRSAQRHPVTAPASSRYWGGMSGRFYVCQGNTLNGRDVVVSMAKAYEETKGSFADRVLAALLAGDCAGGDHRGRLSAGIRICKKDGDGYWLEMHVENNKDAVVALYKQYVESDHEARGEWGKKKFEPPCPNRPAPKMPG